MGLPPNGLEFLKTLGTVAGMAVVAGYLGYLGAEAGRTTVRIFNRLGDKLSLPQERERLLLNLFATNGYTLLVPGEANPLQTGIHPDDKWTATRLKDLFPGTPQYAEQINYDASAHLLCLGSPQSNNNSLYHLGYLRNDDGSIERAKNAGYALHFEYHYPPVTELEKLPSISRYVGGRESIRPPYSLKVNTPLAGHATGSVSSNWDGQAWLSEDWLVISKVPHLAHPEKFVIVVGGLHGTGTKAVISLLDHLPLTTLEEMDAQREGHPYFQSLFHVKKIIHSHEHQESSPANVAHVGTLPVEPGKRSY